MHSPRYLSLGLVLVLAAGAVHAQGARPMPRPAVAAPAEAVPKASALAKLPVKEVTVFKDGHAFVLHEGRMPVDDAGNVVMDYLPAPVLGTFWPYASEPGVKLSAVVASPRRLAVERTALNLRELIEANEGASVSVTELGGEKYDAVILGFTERTSAELEATNPPNMGEALPVKGNLLLLRTSRGVKAVPVERIQDVTFKNEHGLKVTNEEFRHLLTLRLDWQGKARQPQASVGMLYLQKGLRWIPHYKVTIDGAGNAVVQLQATLINELTDLRDATANLVVGVPSFAFQDMPDPIGLQQSVAQLGQHFQQGVRTQFALSNAMMSQVAGGMGAGRFGEDRGTLPSDQPPGDLGPEVAGSSKAENLFVFTVRNITLKKGQRMVLPVNEYRVKYRDVFTLDLPFAPPPEVRGSLNSEQQNELARMLSAPKVMHKIRLSNSTQQPFTTAPALILKGDQVLAQGTMTYTSPGGDVDVTVNPALDISVRKRDRETARTPNAVNHNGTHLTKVELEGSITLTNRRGQPVEVEVTRHVLGNVDSASHDGKVEKVNVFEDDSYAPGEHRPYWWSWYNWPYWWHARNGVARITWDVKLDPGKSQELGYKWHYYAP